ncbi:MAG: hypothetical protein IJ527_02810 [Prevotella sp.]|nr:hypothetical protein [Prevotella sp.]
MGSIDEELRLDAEQDEREQEYISQHLPAELKETFSRDDIFYMMDTIVEYYYESGVLDTDSDEVDVDLQQVAEYVCRRAAEDKVGHFLPDDVFFVAQADLDFQEQEIS